MADSEKKVRSKGTNRERSQRGRTTSQKQYVKQIKRLRKEIAEWSKYTDQLIDMNDHLKRALVNNEQITKHVMYWGYDIAEVNEFIRLNNPDRYIDPYVPNHPVEEKKQEM